MTDGTGGLGIGARLKRKEDARHLRGRGAFVGDFHVPGVRELAFLRSPLAHARLGDIHIPDGADGLVFTAADFADLKAPRVVIDVPGFKPSDHPPIATGKVRRRRNSPSAAPNSARRCAG